jgi:hypothetical protein
MTLRGESSCGARRVSAEENRGWGYRRIQGALANRDLLPTGNSRFITSEPPAEFSEQYVQRRVR